MHGATDLRRDHDQPLRMDGVPIGTLSVIRDVTDRERIEGAAREPRPPAVHARLAGVGDWT